MNQMQPEAEPQAALPSLALMALVVGLSVANPFYSQSLLPAVERAFEVPAGTVLLGPMATQLGMALGFLFLLPLGDIWERRRLLSLLALGMALACMAVVFAPLWLWLRGAKLLLYLSLHQNLDSE